MAFLINFLSILTQILTFAIFARAIMSWFPVSQGNPLLVILDQITEPILGPLRRIVPRIGMIDITPMVAIFILYAISSVLAGM